MFTATGSIKWKSTTHPQLFSAILSVQLRLSNLAITDLQHVHIKSIITFAAQKKGQLYLMRLISLAQNKVAFHCLISAT